MATVPNTRIVFMLPVKKHSKGHTMTTIHKHIHKRTFISVVWCLCGANVVQVFIFYASYINNGRVALMRPRTLVDIPSMRSL